jgi:hypothetical protein
MDGSPIAVAATLALRPGLDRGDRLAELAAAHRPTSATSSARSSWRSPGDVARPRSSNRTGVVVPE